MDNSGNNYSDANNSALFFNKTNNNNNNSEDRAKTYHPEHHPYLPGEIRFKIWDEDSVVNSVENFKKKIATLQDLENLLKDNQVDNYNQEIKLQLIENPDLPPFYRTIPS